MRLIDRLKKWFGKSNHEVLIEIQGQGEIGEIIDECIQASAKVTVTQGGSQLQYEFVLADGRQVDVLVPHFKCDIAQIRVMARSRIENEITKGA